MSSGDIFHISHLGEPQHDNDAVRLSSANDWVLQTKIMILDVTGSIGYEMTYL